MDITRTWVSGSDVVRLEVADDGTVHLTLDAASDLLRRAGYRPVEEVR